MLETNWSKVSHFVATVNADYPRWNPREVGRFISWDNARTALMDELDKLYPGMWEVNYEHPQQFSQYQPKDEYWTTGNFCMGYVDVKLTEIDQLKHDIDRLTKELATKQERLTLLTSKE